MCKYWINKIDQSRWVVGGVFLILILVLAWEAAIGADTDRLDWFNWLFWARQNFFGLTASGDIVGTVMSPVQGLFGSSYPVNPFFNPLWLLAVHIDDPALAHRISTGVIFFLFALVAWVFSKAFISSSIFTFGSVLLCLNAYFKIVPITKPYFLPTSTFNYFELMPPQNFLFLLAMLAVVVVVKVEKRSQRVIALLSLSLLALLSDPMYFFIYFGPVGLVLGVYYLFEIKTRYVEILYLLLGVVCFYLIGFLEYPFALKEVIARGTFNESLYHSTKRLQSAPFAFQANQNIFFYLFAVAILLWNSLVKGNKLALAMTLTQVGLFMLGGVYLATSVNFNQIPNLSILDGALLPLFVVLTASSAEQFLATRQVGLFQDVVKTLGIVVLGMFVLGKVITLDRDAPILADSFTQATLLGEPKGNKERFDGRLSFLVGTRDSAVARTGRLEGPFSKRHVNFLQNNADPEGFFGKYGATVSLTSYWWTGVPTLEENNHLTSAVYFYFFRWLFMNYDDFSFTNINLFTQPMMHLYPMLGVETLISDKPLARGELIKPNSELYVTKFLDANVGHYAPTERRNAISARHALNIMSDPSFDPKKEYVSLGEEGLDVKNRSKTTGQVFLSGKGIMFKGESDSNRLHVLPLLFSHCLRSTMGHQLVRVNLILTGIMFKGSIEDEITFHGPPLVNECLKKDKEDIEKFNLKDQEIPYPSAAHKPILTRWKHVVELFDLMGWW